jgi:hypothetical protein
MIIFSPSILNVRFAQPKPLIFAASPLLHYFQYPNCRLRDEKNIREGKAQRRLQELLNKIERWKFEKDMAPVLARLNSARGLPADRLVAEIRSVVEEHTSRVYRLMQYVAVRFITEHKGSPIVQHVIRHLAAMIGRDMGDPSRLTSAAQDCAIKCMLAMIEELGRLLAQRELTMEDLWSLFSAGPGLALVGRVMFAPFDIHLGQTGVQP